MIEQLSFCKKVYFLATNEYRRVWYAWNDSSILRVKNNLERTLIQQLKENNYDDE